MNNLLYSAILVAVAFGMFVIAIGDLMGTGTCASMADTLPVNCWGTRLVRHVTGWPTKVAAATVDSMYGLVTLVFAFIGKRGE